MTAKAKNILTLDHEEAFDFFMKPEQYYTFELPEYFVFDEILQSVKDAVGTASYEECLAEGSIPDDYSDVNLDILLNKDGRYAVRPISLVNPYLYYFMVRELCAESSWSAILECFGRYSVPRISSAALPVLPQKKEPFHHSSTILNWWHLTEQRAIELSLEYRYMFVSDITNCYGSVNPQSFEWALNMRHTQYETDANGVLASRIQKYLRAFQQGRNIGIPQGSVVFDFVGEIVLGYSDLLLHEAIAREGITEPYEIIRYRDDYRIFCNNRDVLEKISYLLQQVLERLNFRMNSQKTFVSDSIVLDAIKPDKSFYIFNTPIFNKKGVDFDSYEKHLLYILMYGKKYPNGGQLKTMLSDLDKRIEKRLKPKNEVKTTEKDGLDELKQYPTKGFASRKLSGGSVRALAAVCVQIALDNVSVCHYALRTLSRIVDSLEDVEEKQDIISKVYCRMANQPNSTYTQLWLQNITYQQDKKCGTTPYTMRLCRLAAGEAGVELWNNRWLKPAIAEKLDCSVIIDHDRLDQLTPVITFRETRAYMEPEEIEGVDFVMLDDLGL